MKIKYKNNHTMRMVDKNGKRIRKNSLIKFLGYERNPITNAWTKHIQIITKIGIIEETTEQIVLLCGYWRRNPYEVEVVTRSQAVLMAFEDENVRLKF